jgi:hypothetical protein
MSRISIFWDCPELEEEANTLWGNFVDENTGEDCLFTDKEFTDTDDDFEFNSKEYKAFSEKCSIAFDNYIIKHATRKLRKVWAQYEKWQKKNEKRKKKLAKKGIIIIDG